jgi:predicted amidohydrolase YtcJ
MKTKNLFLALLAGLCTACVNKPKLKADLIVHHAVVYSVDGKNTVYESFAVQDGKILEVGTNDSILAKYEGAKMLDAKGKPIFPGFIDAHCHFYGYGVGLREADLVGTHSFDDVVQHLVAFRNMQVAKAKKNNLSPPQWLVGRGWDQNDWKTKEFPERSILDSLFPDTPVFITRVDGHAALVNECALKLAGVKHDTIIPGGELGHRRRKGSDPVGLKTSRPLPLEYLSGLLVDNAVMLVNKIIPAPNRTEATEALLQAQNNCFAVGLTTVDDAGIEKETVDLIDALQQSKDLKMRVYAMLTDSKTNFDYYLSHGPYKTPRLNVRSFKFYADGALGSRGACLLKPYSDKPDQQGFLLNKPEYFKEKAQLMHINGFQMNTHCIGDSAVRMMLNIYESCLGKLKNQSDTPGSRWRIEHFQVSTPQDIASLKAFKNDIIPSVQPTHATSDMYWVKDRLGTERMTFAYAYQEQLQASGKLALGNALSREQTLRGMTIWAAFANFEEKEKGSIEPGKYADFILLNNDLIKCDDSKILSTHVLATWVNGEQVFERK